MPEVVHPTEMRENALGGLAQQLVDVDNEVGNDIVEETVEKESERAGDF